MIIDINKEYDIIELRAEENKILKQDDNYFKCICFKYENQLEEELKKNIEEVDIKEYEEYEKKLEEEMETETEETLL